MGSVMSSRTGFALTLESFESTNDPHDVSGFFPQGDLHPWLGEHRGNGRFAAIDQEVTVTQELPGLRSRGCKAEPEDHVVEPALEQREKILTSSALHPARRVHGLGELRLEQSVHSLDLLLFAELHAEIGKARATVPVLARRVVPLLDGALFAVAAIALQKQLLGFAAAQPAN
jgi:hypothetical protein